MASLAQGTSVTFAGATYTVTRVTVNRGSNSGSLRQRISTASLASNPNEEEPYLEIWQPRADEGGGNTVEMDFLGSGAPSSGSTGTLAVTGGISFSTVVTCSSSSVTAAVGDLLRGSASFTFK